MSYPYPQDRHRDRREKGEQPYKDAAETFGQKEAKLDREAGVPPEEQSSRSIADQERDAEDRFEDIGNDVADDQEDRSD